MNEQIVMQKMVYAKQPNFNLYKFHHDPLRLSLLFLIRYKTQIHKLDSSDII